MNAFIVLESHSLYWGQMRFALVMKVLKTHIQTSAPKAHTATYVAELLSKLLLTPSITGNSYGDLVFTSEYTTPTSYICKSILCTARAQ